MVSIIHLESAIFAALTVVDFHFNGSAGTLNALDVNVAVFAGHVVVDLDSLAGSHKISFTDLDRGTRFVIETIPAKTNSGRDEEYSNQCKSSQWQW